MTKMKFTPPADFMNRPPGMPNNKLPKDLSRAARLSRNARKKHDFGNLEPTSDTRDGNNEFSINIHLPTAARAKRSRGY